MHHHITRQTFDPSHWVSALDPRVKLLSAFALLGLVISSHGIAFSLVVTVLSLALCLNLGVTPKTLALRFSEPVFIAGTVLILKLFCAGNLPLFTWHLAGIELVGHRDGLWEGVQIAGRIAGGVTILAVVGFSTPFTELMAALSWLRVPQSLIDVALFAWRYLFLLLEDAQVVYHAQRNRLGYVGYRRGLSSFGTLAGVLVIKAFDNSQSVTTAMVQRGYDGQMPMLLHKPFVARQVFCSLFFVSSLALIRFI
ncbi:cobalt ECF transporter T component CbiQ [Geomonas silvestris]|uniref:Cobalt ECF transporter T component CbiQ n=1 Tax=Geomonas silvestris TaxID=2740184 RepID=A0A6V8MEX2_9BACT|nr:cobalt ECF transporter T component CbiQ [Geomonas silvestris]GFO58558.1 cobalt ECF transporter T component CbiQ [Geomonas silvestris]